MVIVRVLTVDFFFYQPPLFSGSYGAWTFAHMFPQYVGRFALDGVAPPGSVRCLLFRCRRKLT